eukprot:CAMPEP_0184675944 /NCGR_PEP_ID=MMETSP0308-20130426/88085_1 /TAXON_ID=38269 /ORGANISM="Gloeochaete witrockiana, Strain SAG 46.84" /LENGTH=472 /DNA_ID=CAMNT_0027123739 /DNA_START=147 /DNA_END=1567 /DNA_ORIENTATION=+
MHDDNAFLQTAWVAGRAPRVTFSFERTNHRYSPKSGFSFTLATSAQTPSPSFSPRPPSPTISINNDTPGNTRPTRAVVDLAALERNFLSIQNAVGPSTKVLTVLKANAYGHGIVPVARYLENHLGPHYFGVAIPEEGIELRNAGIESPILVLGSIARNQVVPALMHDLTLTAHSIDKLTWIDNAAKSLEATATVHLEFDTGMERVGVHWYNADTLIRHSLSCENCFIEGVYSHFAHSDAADLASAREQLSRFKEVLDVYDKLQIPTPPIRHLANSGAILQLPDSYFDMVRAGILLYGVYPSHECQRSIAVEPCLSLQSKVVYFKVVEEGMAVSYGHTWTAPKQTRVVTVPIGYGDGYPRALSNVGQVLIRGRRYPVIGRICMDQLMVNIDWDEAYNGDDVVLLGSQNNTPDKLTDPPITVDELATLLGTIPYEVLTNLPPVYPESMYIPPHNLLTIVSAVYVVAFESQIKQI